MQWGTLSAEKKHFAVWICWNKPWTCRVRAWQRDNYQEQDQMQLLLWFIHFYCICNEGCEADHWKVPISKIPQLTLSTHKGHCAYIRPTAEINARARNTHDKLWNLSEFLNLTTRVWWRGDVQRQRMSNLFGYLDVIFKRPLKSISNTWNHFLSYKLKIKFLPSILVSVCDMDILSSIFNNFVIWSSVVEVLHSLTKCKILNFGTFHLERLFT